MNTPDQNIIKIAEDQKLKNNISYSTFAMSIGIDPSNLTKIKNSDKKTNQNYHFTLEQIKKVGQIYNADMNFVFGFSEIMYRKKGVTPNVTLSNIKAKEVI